MGGLRKFINNSSYLNFKESFKVPTDRAHLLHLRTAEKNVAFPRFLVILLNSVVYYFMDKDGTIPWLVYVVMGIALLYSLYIIIFKAYLKYTIFLASYFTSITDGLLISFWIIATGGFESPFYPLWYVSILAITFRYSMRTSLLVFCLYAFLNFVILFMETDPIEHQEIVAVRIGYIFIIGLFGGLLSTDAKDQIQANIKITKSEKRAKAAEIKLRNILKDLQNEINERKKAETILYKKTKELELAKQNAEHSEEIKQQFLGNMSHEIRTPLNGILGFTDLLADTKLSENQTKYIGVIKNSGELLLAIVNDILDISKIEAGKMNFEETSFSISDTINGVVELFLAKTAEKNIRLTSKIDENLAKTLVIGDPVRFNQVLMNLINNAIKFTAEGEVTVAAQIVKQSDDNIVVECKVQDTGIGIREDKLSGIFERFTQADSHTTRKHGGTGLGLAIVKKLIDLQEGKLSVESKENKGATFSFTLQFKKGKDIEQSQKKKVEKDFTFSELKGVKVLLVDDNETNQLLGEKILTKYGMDVDIAEDGEVAIKKLVANQYAIVLMDIQMPILDGHQATRYIREKLPSPMNQVPIIAMTAGVGEKEVEKCFDSGMNEYIAKPINKQNLIFKIHSFIKQNKIISKENMLTDNPISGDENSHNQVVNLDNIRDVAMGDNQFIIKIINSFLSNIPEEIMLLENACEKKDFPELSRISHKMKTTVSVVGLSETQKILKDIEIYSKEEKEIDGLEELKTKIIETCNTAIKELKIELEKLMSK